MPPQTKRKTAPDSPQKTNNKKSKQPVAPAPGDNHAPPTLSNPADNLASEEGQTEIWLHNVLQSLRNECIIKSPYYERAPDLPIIRPGVGSKIRKQIDKAFEENPNGFQQLMDRINNLDETELPPPLSPRGVDARLRRMGIKIPSEIVAVPDVDSLKGALLSNPHLVGELTRVYRLELDLEELKESVTRERQALFNQLVEVALARERAINSN